MNVKNVSISERDDYDNVPEARLGLLDTVLGGVVDRWSTVLDPADIRSNMQMTTFRWWCRGAVGRVSDLRSRGRGFESRPGTRRKNSGQVCHTYVPLFTKQYKLVPAKGR